MRVISGTARSCKLQTLEGLSTRPTVDRIKEDLFNILSPDLYDCRFLDLFSGSGAIGIEALSRGAQQAVFVEKNKEAAKVIRANLCRTKLDSKAKVLEIDAVTALRSLKSERFDMIFMDPPYAEELVDSCLSEILKNNLLSEGGKVICETAAGDKTCFSGYRLEKVKEYKTTQMLYFIKLEN